MPLLFSYGTLQRPAIQRATFGREVRGQPDELPGHEACSVRIGSHSYRNVRFNGREDSRIAGTLFEVTDEELARADAYESDAAYERVEATLSSGRRAWVYRNTAAP
jgi:gamma-glutamylcyclotransferase (GGCT)/AIG2-like uncharacterized protein YtfP